MKDLPVKKPSPDFEKMIGILKGSVKPDRLMYAEILIDEEVKEFIVENYFGEKNHPPPVEHWGSDRETALDLEEKKKAYEKYYKQMVDFYYRMGYSLFADLTFIVNFESLNTIIHKTKDTAQLSGADRHWAVEGTGVIKSWDDFERFPWERAEMFIYEYEDHLKLREKIVPDGMKIGPIATLFEEPLEWILGYEGFFLMLNDDPKLVKAIFDKVGKIMYDFYDMVLTSNIVGCAFHADDLGYKSGTMISVDHLQKLVFPWFKKYVDIAHKNGKPFFLHSCGNRDQIMDILIDEVGLDAVHSFEDVSYPVTRYLETWGKRVGIIGGIDVDKMARYDEDRLREYIRETLEICSGYDRYVAGSGNSIANYIPIDNYLLMLEEINNWQG